MIIASDDQQSSITIENSGNNLSDIELHILPDSSHHHNELPIRIIDIFDKTILGEAERSFHKPLTHNHINIENGMQKKLESYFIDKYLSASLDRGKIGELLTHITDFLEEEKVESRVNSPSNSKDIAAFILGRTNQINVEYNSPKEMYFLKRVLSRLQEDLIQKTIPNILTESYTAYKDFTVSLSEENKKELAIIKREIPLDACTNSTPLYYAQFSIEEKEKYNALKKEFLKQISTSLQNEVRNRWEKDRHSTPNNPLENLCLLENYENEVTSKRAHLYLKISFVFIAIIGLVVIIRFSPR